jgi:hypothetical protein
MPLPVNRRLLRRASSIVALAALAWSASAPLLAREGGFDAAALEAWARAHGGVDGPRTYAYGGTVYDVPGGKILATVDGWQLARTFPGGARDPGAWYVVRRAFLLYRAPDSGEILARYPDVRSRSAPVPVLSIVRFALRGDRVVTSGVSGVRGATREVALPEQLGAAREDDAWVFLRVLSPPDPQQKPIELTEIVARDGGTDAAPRAGRHVLHLSWRPVAGLESVAPVLRQLVTAEAPSALASLPASLEAAYAELGLPLPPRPTAP